MRKSFGISVAVGAALLGFLFLVPAASIPAAAQQRGAGQATTTPVGPMPHTSWDGKPDLTGTWGPATAGPGPNQDKRSPSNAERRTRGLALDALYQPWARERSRKLAYLDDPRYHCGPYGFPKYVNIPDYFLLQIVQAPKETLVFTEYIYSGFRIITTDGTPHPQKIVPSFFGDSVARWEGDTLVVDVTGFNGKIWLPGVAANPQPPGTGGQNNGRGGRGQNAGEPEGGGFITSDALHEVERWRLLDADTLEYEATVEDPKVLTGPWTTPKSLLKRAPADVVIHEALCLDPEDLAHMKATEKKK
jgi:hypothetical protein